ncbi:MAG: hypothetical protein HXY48_00685 [Ignavibacteriaceae bacterium]|nr:hypothetical protein [Ignavibacteriaceae bacterium]
MKLLIFSIIILNLLPYSKISAQPESYNKKQNQLYLEIGGNSLVYSISYERLLSENFTLRGGFGITPGIIFAEGTFIHIPFTASYMFGSKRHKLETGLGATYFAGTDVEIFGLPSGDQSLVFLTGIAGYRYVSPGGFVFRIFFTPLYSSQADPNFYPAFGLSFGFML